jgi:chaperone required for assembly of F1-ATPase
VKRFWQEVTVVAGEILLDGRPVRTPARVPLTLPRPALADLVAAEWRGIGETLDPRAMPLTGLANAAIDRVAPDAAAFAEGLARYAESDLLCYRAHGPEELVLRQAAAWDPPLGWARARYDIGFTIVAGIVHRAQPPATIARLGEAVAVLDAWTLAALSPVVTLTGSLVLGLALVERAMAPEAVWAAAELDEAWQAEQWGQDALAAQASAERRAAFAAATAFLAALDD